MLVRLMAVLALFGALSSARGIEVISEAKQGRCETFDLVEELHVYKDPTLFLTTLNTMLIDPDRGWHQLMDESPLLTTVTGEVRMMRLGEPRRFKNFGPITRLYSVVEPRLRIRRPEKGAQTPWIVPITFCGERDPYHNTLGFVLVADLEQAQRKRYRPQPRIRDLEPPRRTEREAPPRPQTP